MFKTAIFEREINCLLWFNDLLCTLYNGSDHWGSPGLLLVVMVMSLVGYPCSELMYLVIFNYWQYWTILWTKVLYRGI